MRRVVLPIGRAESRVRMRRLGSVEKWSVMNGRDGSGTISFDLDNTGSHRFSGTFTATRITGTFVITQTVRSTPTTQTGSFAVNRP